MDLAAKWSRVLNNAALLTGAFWLICGLLLSSPAAAATPFELVEIPLDDPALGLSSQEEFLPSRGQLNALVVFAQFEDESHLGQGVPDFASLLFDPEQPGSFTHFYDTMSFGQLTVRGMVLGRRYTAAGPARVYQAKQPGNPGRYGLFVEEILRQVDLEVDLGQFDNDGPDKVPNSGDDDGRVDYIFVLLRSAPENFILKGATGIAGLGLEQDYYTEDASVADGHIHVSGRWAHGAIMQEGAFPQTVGAMAHEFGHSLGLPDLYDPVWEGPDDDSAGIGKWGLMGRGALGWNGSDGPVPLCAWSREQLGWIGLDNERLVEIQRDTLGLVIADLHDQGAIYKIPLRVQNYQGILYTQEYLLLEHRSRTAHPYNRPLPEGLLIWHVDQQAQYAVKGWAVDNKHEEKKMVDLVCADGLYQDAGFPLGRTPDPHYGRDNLDYWAHDESYQEAHGGNLGDATDPFDGRRFTRFDRGSNPSSQFDHAPPLAATGLTLQNIHRQDQRMVMDVRLPDWAGTIREDVFWSGECFVDGDLTIAPEGRLFIYSNTIVRFAGNDRLRAGRDPSRCELIAEGSLRILLLPSRRYDRGAYEPIAPEAVVFEAQEPGKTWWGIAAGAAAQVDMPEDLFILRDETYGRVVSEAELGSGQPTAVPDAEIDGPATFALGPNYPNPFSLETRLRYRLAESASVLLRVFDALGQQVRTLVDGDRPQGEQEVVWNGQDEDGRDMGSGLYVVRMEVPGRFAATHKLMRLPGGFSRFSDLDSTLQARGISWQALGDALRLPAAPEFGLATGATPARAAFTLGSLWVYLAVLGDSEDRERFQAHAERLAALMMGFEPSRRQRQAVEGFSQSACSGAAPPGKLLASLRPMVEELLQNDEDALYFFLGEWFQTLRTAAAAARELSLPLAALVAPVPNGETGQLFAAQLDALGADQVLRTAMQDLAASLRAAPRSQEEIDALHELIERIHGLLILR